MTNRDALFNSYFILDKRTDLNVFYISLNLDGHNCVVPNYAY